MYICAYPGCRVNLTHKQNTQNTDKKANNNEVKLLDYSYCLLLLIRVITKLPNSEQSYKGKVKTHNYINRQNQSTTENCENRNDPDLVQAFLKKWWVE
jgi:hypothetical protein